MQIRIRTIGHDLTDETSSYLHGRIEALQRFVDPFDETALCEVEIGRAIGGQKEGEIWRAEFQIVRGGERLRSEAIASTINAAIDAAKDEMLQQLRKSKGKHFALARRAGAKIKSWLRFGSEE